MTISRRKKSLIHFLNTLFLASLLGSVPRSVQAAEAKPFQDLSQTPPTAVEEGVLETFAFLVNTGQLDGFLKGTLKVLEYTPFVGGKVRAIPPETRKLGVHIGAEAVRMLVQMRGEDAAYPGITYLPWQHVSRWMEKRLKAQEDARSTSFANSISDPRYYEELLSLAETRESRARDLEILVNGPASFAKREELIRQARKSIDLMAWAILDDETGFGLRDQLIAKHRAGVEVRVMVDNLVSQRPGYRQAVRDLAVAGIEVVRWRDKNVPFFGQHRKMMIVDGTYMVAGGLNPGNTYSHKGVSEKDKWRDTDIYATGEIVDEGNRLFAELWNAQSATKLPPRVSFIRGGDIPISLVNHKPDPRRQTGSTIMLSLLKAIRGAQKSVDIENAYVILFPELEREIQKALARGVRVRVLTNSDQSVDEAIVSQPLLISSQRLARMGAEVYLRQGSTLHSKFLVIDNELVAIGSYNLHPRSERVEGEMIFWIRDTKTAQDFTRIFEKDLNPAVAKKATAEEIHPDLGFTVKFTLRYFYDLL